MAGGHHDFLYGRIGSAWKRVGNKLSMDITIPLNITATVYVSVRDEAGVTESGKPAGNARGVNFLRMEGQSAIYAVGSGVYHFESSW